MFFRKIAIVPKLNARDSKAVASVEAVVREAIDACYKTPVLISKDNIHEIDSTTLIIAIGGDGTMLEAMRLAYKKNAYAIGINLGTVGFLTDLNLHQHLVNELIDLFCQAFTWNAQISEYTIEERMVLSTPENHVAFNEFVISNVYSDQILKYHLKIGPISAGHHRANGLIISTPTGSTAYSLSVGGVLMLPSMEAVQIVPIAPIGLTSRPIIVPGNVPITIVIESTDQWKLKADGQDTDTTGNMVCIDQSKEKVKVIHTKDWSYFKMLTDKLGWKTHG